MSYPASQHAAAIEALERLLAWPEMARSPQLARFMEYIVRRTLDGDGQAIKAYSIAVDVFGRSADFDPQADPIVRVQARRLRSLLEEYYSGPGAGERLRIRLPVGRYIPEFVTSPVVAAEHVAPEPALEALVQLAQAAKGPGVTWYILALIALAVAMLAYATALWGPA